MVLCDPVTQMLCGVLTWRFLGLPGCQPKESSRCRESDGGAIWCPSLLPCTRAWAYRHLYSNVHTPKQTPTPSMRTKKVIRFLLSLVIWVKHTKQKIWRKGSHERNHTALTFWVYFTWHYLFYFHVHLSVQFGISSP